ncbi:SNF2 family N-terminal domain-containing protein [Trichophaea hybrida]|nr:SNF2 family N-terminal domain-containing protein [Trichophaea hybrida]
METYPRKRRLDAGESSSCSSGNESSTEKRQRLQFDPDAMAIDMNSPLPKIECHDYSTGLELHHDLSYGISDDHLKFLDARDRNSSPSLSLLDIASTTSSQDFEIPSHKAIDDDYSPSRSPYTDDPELEEAKDSPFTHENKLLARALSRNQATPYGVCFGMLSAKIIDRQSVASNNSIIPVQLSFEKGIVRLKTSREYMGLMEPRISKELSFLSKQHPIHLDAFAVNSRRDKQSKLPEHIVDKLVYVVLYGNIDIRDGVGQYLSDKRLYLQHPLTYDTSVTYDNPHYFLPPGETLELPNLLDLNLGDGQTKPTSGILDEALEIFEGVVIPEDHKNVELEVISGLKTTLKEHQKVAVAFMVEKENGRLEGNRFGCDSPLSLPTGPRLIKAVFISSSIRYRNVVTGSIQTDMPSLPLGGLLADSMGLGKTLVALALVAADLAAASASQIQLLPTLIIAPTSTLIGWKNQIERHFENGTFQLHVYHGDQRDRDVERLSSYNIILTTYDTLVSDLAGKKTGCLSKIAWRRVILDEAHSIKDKTTKRFKATYTLESKYRWCLTGTPIQNRIDDFAALLSFLRVHPFDRSFKKSIIDPLKSANPGSLRKLRLLVSSVSLRRTKAALGSVIQLPTRKDITQDVEFSKEERALYDFAKQQANSLLKGRSEETSTLKEYQSILQAILRLRQICNHNTDLWPAKLNAQFLERYQLSQGLGQAFFDTLDSCEACGEDINENPPPDVTSSCPHILCGKCTTGSKTSATRCSKTSRNFRSHACPLCFACDFDSMENEVRTTKTHRPQKQRPKHCQPSSKVKSLINNLRKDQSGEDGSQKSVVFSCWTTMLDLVEIALEDAEIGFERLDGSMTLKQRSSALQNFSGKVSCQVLLASIQCAGVGLDLTAASRVHLLEPQWNPSSEEQALDRVHRMGQTRPVETYRYTVKNSIDEYVTALQYKKLQLVKLSFGGESSSHQGLEDLKSLLR